ncbi:MAG TPA: hypothetical protein VMH27_17700 [Puia sp.]|nr:hypothetical protein [Puia sp.]
MSGNWTIRIKAALMSVIFTGNFLVVCHCPAVPSGPTRSARMPGHCCCKRNAQPCKEKNDCPGTQAVKFNLMAKRVAPSVMANAGDAVRSTPVRHDWSTRCPSTPRSWYALPRSLHSPPDRLALYRCFLV